jgi:hypothetical protein
MRWLEASAKIFDFLCRGICWQRTGKKCWVRNEKGRDCLPFAVHSEKCWDFREMNGIDHSNFRGKSLVFELVSIRTKS